MKKIGKLVFGGIHQKIYNLVLFNLILVVAAYTIVIFYQANQIQGIVSHVEEEQKALSVLVYGHEIDEDFEGMSAAEKQYLHIMQDASDQMRSSLERGGQTVLVLLIAVLVLGTTGAVVMADRIVKPLNKMANRVKSLGGEQLQFQMEDAYKTGDEVEVLAESFADLSGKTIQYLDEVKRVTAEKERIGAELDVAKHIQADMLPNIFPAFPGRPEIDIYASMDPAKEVGGDFYDFFLIDNDHLAMVMADVSGKGVPAALFMVIAKTLIKNRAQMGGTPAEILKDVNQQLCEGNDSQLFVTVWLGILDLRTGEGMAANAGHEHPALRRKGGRYELVEYRHSPAVAVMENLEFREHSFRLEPGDSLFVYTDGVAEATNEENMLFGTERMIEALNIDPEADLPSVLNNVRRSIDAFVGDAQQFDDITMLCMQYMGPQAA